MPLTRPELRALFTAERERLYRLLFRLTRNAQDAEDLLQETFLAAWRKREAFEGRGAPEGWLRRTAVRLWLNTRQVAARRRPTLVVDDVERTERETDPRGANGHASGARAAAPADAELERRDAVEFLVARVHEALEHLPDEAREVFVLFRQEGFSCAEIAELTGAPVKTVETRLRRATLALADRLRAWRNLLPAS